MVGGHPDAAVAERHLRAVGPLVEGEEAVEGLPLASLVVELAGDGVVEGEEGRSGAREHRSAEHGLEEGGTEPVAGLSAQPGHEGRCAEGQGHEKVVGLRIGRDTQKDGGQERATTRRGQARHDQPEVEHLRRGPEHVEGGHGRAEERQGRDEGRERIRSRP